MPSGCVFFSTGFSGRLSSIQRGGVVGDPQALIHRRMIMIDEVENKFEPPHRGFGIEDASPNTWSLTHSRGRKRRVPPSHQCPKDCDDLFLYVHAASVSLWNEETSIAPRREPTSSGASRRLVSLSAYMRFPPISRATT